MKTAKQLADLSDDDLAKELEGYLLGLELIGADGEIENQEAYNAAKEQFEALANGEDWEGLAALIQGAEIGGGSSGALDADIEQTRVAVGGVRTSSGDNAIIGTRIDPLEKATEELETADRTLLRGFIEPREEYRLSDYADWLQNISEGDKERLAQALYVQGYYNNMGIQDLEDITDPTYFANAIQGALRDAQTSAATFGEDIGLSAVPTLEEGGRFAGSTEEEFREAERIFLRDSGPQYLPVSYLKETGRQISKKILGRHFNSSEERQYIAMANALLDDQTNPARLRNEQVDLQTAGAEFARELAPEEAEARNVGSLMSVVDRVLGL